MQTARGTEVARPASFYAAQEPRTATADSYADALEARAMLRRVVDTYRSAAGLPERGEI